MLTSFCSNLIISGNVLMSEKLMLRKPLNKTKNVKNLFVDFIEVNMEILTVQWMSLTCGLVSSYLLKLVFYLKA